MNTDKEFVPHQPSLDMKELGFDEPCFTFYPKEGKMGFDGKYHSIKEGYKNSTVNDIWIKRYKNDFGCVTAPTYSQAFRWFREKYKLVSYIRENEKNNFGYEWVIEGDDFGGETESRKGWTYEEAELACLIKLIEICKNK